MSVAFVLIFPLGATLLRLFKSKHAVWIHIGIQLTGWALMLGGLATGLRVGKIIDRVTILLLILISATSSVTD
jgi:hypothetical protein